MTSPGDLPRIRTRTQLLADGWTDGQIRRAVRHGRLTAALAGTYAVDGASATERRVLLAALHARLGSASVGVLGTAALVHGLPTPWPEDGLVHVRVPPGREHAQRPGVRFHAWQLDANEIEERHGLRVTTVERTVVDLMCSVDRLSAVSALDAALHTGTLSTEAVARLAATTRRRRGAARSRSWWEQADGRVESPLETRVRLRATDGGYPPDAVQHGVEVDGHRYRADLAWQRSDGRWLLAEADGVDVHGALDALYQDRRRANQLVGTGDVDILRFTWADTTRPGPVVRALAPLLGPPRQRPARSPRP